MAKNNKRITFKEIISEEKSKKVRVADEAMPIPVKSQNPAWQISIMDFGGDWGWHTLTLEQLKDIHDKLRSFESMTWGEIETKRTKGGSQQNHIMSVSRICKEAQERLAEIELDDTDALYSLRLSQTNRVWGIRQGDGVLKILWWDPEHSVYPMETPNT